jgi:hypothetical protein
LGQILGTIFGLIAAFAIVFAVLTFGAVMPEDLISSVVVQDFLTRNDLELKFAIVGTVLYPPLLGENLGFGASGSTVLMFLAWGTAGLIAGLLSRDWIPAVFAAVFSVIAGALLIWLLIFVINTGDFGAIFGSESFLLLEYAIQGCIFPVIAAVVGAVLGGGITRRRA